ncbi:MAG: sigma-70 family RNA polymerase sigma factor [Verrucomicrobiota bacterium]
METSAASDSELLAAWVEHRREPAFHALVARYATLVHMAAKRTCGDDSLAADASQLVFILLAQKAKSLITHPTLAGWLHVTAVMKTRDLIDKARRESRKRQRLSAAMETNSSASCGDTWKEMQPVLDDALAALSEKDREALLLRFYRSLTIREIAATLGIATDAAQKRIDRATERLRGKLARRGVQAGGSLGAAMVTGFAADAQAAGPAVSLLVSKAVAAGTASCGVAPFSIIYAASMKTTSAIVPFFLLVAAGVWIAGQFQSIATLERQNQSYQKSLAVSRITPVSAKREREMKTALDGRPVDWEEVARQLASASSGYLGTTLRLQEGFLTMSREELINALDEIETSDLSRQALKILRDRLGKLLAAKDPEYGAKRFIVQLYDDDSGVMSGLLLSAVCTWVEQDQKRGLEWFDEQTAKGTFGRKNANGIESYRLRFENRLFNLLISKDPDIAGKRLAALPPDQRIKMFQEERIRLKQSDHGAFVKVIRGQLPEADCLNAITWPVSELGEGGTVTYQELGKYLDENQATPAERDACILAVAGRSRFMRKSGRFSDVTAEDMDAWRTWVGERSPGLQDGATAKAMEGLLRVMSYPAIAELALNYKSAGAGDEILLPLFGYQARDHKDLAREIAGKLTDVHKRAEILKQLGGQP